MSDTAIEIRAGAGDGNGQAKGDGGGGPAPRPVVTPEAVAAADGSLAARLRAKREELARRTKRLRVPPDDVWNGELVLVVKAIRLRDNMSNVALITEATEQLLILDPDSGEFEPVAGGWEGIGELMGVSGAGEKVTLGEIVTAVCSTADVAGRLAEQVLSFILGRESKIEQALGE